jgi:hypothetical protein
MPLLPKPKRKARAARCAVRRASRVPCFVLSAAQNGKPASTVVIGRKNGRLSVVTEPQEISEMFGEKAGKNGNNL